MFWTVPLSIMRSFLLYTQQWYMSYRFANSLRAGSGWNILILLASCLVGFIIEFQQCISFGQGIDTIIVYSVQPQHSGQMDLQSTHVLCIHYTYIFMQYIYLVVTWLNCKRHPQFLLHFIPIGQRQSCFTSSHPLCQIVGI